MIDKVVKVFVASLGLVALLGTSIPVLADSNYLVIHRSFWTLGDDRPEASGMSYARLPRFMSSPAFVDLDRPMVLQMQVRGVDAPFSSIYINPDFSTVLM